jgi:hypothetical protein
MRRDYIKGEWCCIIEQKKMLALKIKDKRELEALYQRCGLPKEQAQNTATNG